MTRVAFQGERGAYSELAIARHFGPDYDAVGCRTLMDLQVALLSEQVDYAVVPLENSIAGIVPDARGVVEHDDVERLADFWLRIEHCLLAVSGTSIELLRTVISHSMALAQCTKFFDQHPRIAAMPWYDTAGAAEHVAHLRDISLACIAAEAAAQRHGLTILARNLEDRPDNQTHFVVIRRKAR